jgi:hypothetical protein
MKFFSYTIILLTVCLVTISALIPKQISSRSKLSFKLFVTATQTASGAPSADVTPKSVTAEIMQHFNQNGGTKKDAVFQKRLSNEEVKKNIDGLHIITVLFQSARSKRLAKDLIPMKFLVERLAAWDREWSERDISMFVYGVRSLEGLDSLEGDLIRLGAKKISESSAGLTSRAIGNALYGLQDITSDTDGAPALCAALADKIEMFNGDLNGQDIGIGMYGLQGMSADVPEVRRLVDAIGTKISRSISELDSQATSNALYGLQVRYTISISQLCHITQHQ